MILTASKLVEGRYYGSDMADIDIYISSNCSILPTYLLGFLQ